jgi:hypothetical protein
MFRRSLSWSAALRDIRADRIQFTRDERNAHCRQRAFAKLAAERAGALSRICPLVKAGAYDRRAIMCAAIAAAKARRAVSGDAWSLCISAALSGTWQAAKAARRTATARERERAEDREKASRRDNSQPLGPEGEGSAADFGGVSSQSLPSPLTRPPVAPSTRGFPDAGASLILAPR